MCLCGVQCLNVFGGGCGDAVFECVWWCWCVVMQCLSVFGGVGCGDAVFECVWWYCVW